MSYALRRIAIAGSFLLTILPLLLHPASTLSARHIPLFTHASMPSFVGVYGLIMMSAFVGLYRKGNALGVLFFACTLAGAAYDARLAPVFALVAAPLLTQRAHA